MYTVDSLKFVVSEKLDQVQKQISNLEKYQKSPHILDDKTVQRLIERYTQEKLIIKELMITIRSSLQGNLSVSDRKTMKKVNLDINVLDKSCHQILFLTKNFKAHTINKIIEKNDVELTLDILKSNNK